MQSDPRTALFISHANPEGNTFTLWLGAKLAAVGYEVWADVLRLKGGQDWQRKLENALRHRACKLLLVANATSVEKQGVRNEIQIASTVAKAIGDTEFIIPLRLAAFEAPFLIAHAQYIDFEQGWTRGLKELLATLHQTYKVPRRSGTGDSIWRDIQLLHAREVVKAPERLLSNWLALTALPKVVRRYEFKAGISVGLAQKAMKSGPWPLVPHGHGFLSFAPLHDLQDHFGASLPLTLVGEKRTDRFVKSGWKERKIEPWSARNHFSDLARQALERMFAARGLRQFALSARQSAFWAPVNAAPTNKVSFRWGQISGQRQIQGFSAKRSINWHFGVSVSARTAPLLHVRVISRLIFTQDGQKPFDDPARMHRLRRSFAKSWRNARWRDMLLAFLYWLANGKSELIAATSSEEALVVRLPPIDWIAPVSMPIHAEAKEPDDDDPSDEDEPEALEIEDNEGEAAETRAEEAP